MEVTATVFGFRRFVIGRRALNIEVPSARGDREVRGTGRRPAEGVGVVEAKAMRYQSPEI